MTISGANSQWSNAEDLMIGMHADSSGMLDIQSGGKVAVGGTTTLGFGAGSNPGDGTLNIAGEGSTFATGVDLVVGVGGSVR